MKIHTQKIKLKSIIQIKYFFLLTVKFIHYFLHQLTKSQSPAMSKEFKHLKKKFYLIFFINCILRRLSNENE